MLRPCYPLNLLDSVLPFSDGSQDLFGTFRPLPGPYQLEKQLRLLWRIDIGPGKILFDNMDYFLAERAMLLFCPFLKGLINLIVHASDLENNHHLTSVNNIQNDLTNYQALFMRSEIPPNFLLSRASSKWKAYGFFRLMPIKSRITIVGSMHLEIISVHPHPCPPPCLRRSGFAQAGVEEGGNFWGEDLLPFQCTLRHSRNGSRALRSLSRASPDIF